MENENGFISLGGIIKEEEIYFIQELINYEVVPGSRIFSFRIPYIFLTIHVLLIREMQ